MGKKRGRERGPAAAADDTQQTDVPQDLSACLDLIGQSPLRYDLYTRALELAQDFEERDMTRQLWVQQFSLSEDQWREWIADRVARAKDSPSEEAYKAVLELYEVALTDLKSLPLMELLVEYILSQYYSCRALVRPDADQIQAGEGATKYSGRSEDVEQQAIWSEDIIGALLQRTAIQSSYDWAKSHTIWQHLFIFLRDLFLRQSSNELQERINELFLVRLAEPHLQHEQTMQDYSSFITATDQANYEAHLLEAQSVYAPAKEMILRHEKQEQRLSDQQDNQGELAYINYATSLNKQNEVNAASSLFERGLAAHPAALDIWAAYLRLKYSILRKEMEKGDFESTTEGANEILALATRATRHMPASADTWIALMFANERVGELSAAENNFARAMATGNFDKNIEDLTKLYTARADIHRQAWQDVVAGESSLEEVEGFVEVDVILREGIERVKKVQRSGDPSLRLERYLIRFFERNDNLQEAAQVIAKAVQANKGSYAGWTAQADLYVRHNQIDAARAVFLDAMKMILDYPEYLFDAYMTFEHHHGSLHEIQEAENAVAGKMRAIHKARQHQAEQFQLYQSQEQVSQGGKHAQQGESNMQVDSQPIPSTSKVPIEDVVAGSPASKRPAESSTTTANSSKKPKTTHDATSGPKRDRERTTVIVSKLPPEAEEQDLRQLFKDCDEIFDIKLFPHQKAATVEFAGRESVPMAKTKDKKLVRGEEVDVNAAWASTLWLTNFAEGMDDAAMRQMLSPYGDVLEIRWPDRSFKTTRRFAYVTMVTEAAARKAIDALHDKPVEGSSFTMQVHISDPDRKRSRTDAKANLREVRVTNLKPSVTSELLTKVFSECGVVQTVRVDGKGAAFVEYVDEESVSSAVSSLNDRELMGKHIAVTRVDQRGGPGLRPQTKGKAAKAKSDFQARIVRLTHLPPHVQSDLIRQEFEKLSLHVVEIGMDADGQAASVEFANVADAGRALLLPAGAVVISDTANTISEGFETKSAPLRPRQISPGSAPAASSVPAFMPRNARGVDRQTPRGGGRGRGAGRGGRGGFAGGNRPGIGAARTNGAAVPKGQDAFRAMLSGGSAPTNTTNDSATNMQE